MIQDLLQGTNLYLIGMMGAGKSTVGKQLAEQLGYRFVDTDTVIEQTTSQSITEIFAAQGEAAFRKLETQVLNQVATYPSLVVATGGGIVLRPINWSYLQYGAVIWLDAPVAQLVERLSGDRSRPLLQAADLHERLTTLLDQRRQRYAQADICITQALGESPTQVCDRILMALPKIIKPLQKPTPKES
ncbi:MAG: shikimate kinase [Leptolyngbya sp. SIO4C1]|nr:shikimate kinase [Leptolyngbya sp. SIO4C1]